jgi:hypothetical protein
LDSLLEGLQGFPTLKQIVSLNIGLKRIISDYNQGHIIRELRTWESLRCLTASCKPYPKHVTGRFGDGRIFPPMKWKQFKIKYSFFLKRKVSETLFANFKCECTSGELPSNRRCSGRPHVIQA